MRSYTISIPLNESYTLANAGRSTTFTLTGGTTLSMSCTSADTGGYVRFSARSPFRIKRARLLTSGAPGLQASPNDNAASITFNVLSTAGAVTSAQFTISFQSFNTWESKNITVTPDMAVAGFSGSAYACPVEVDSGSLKIDDFNVSSDYEGQNMYPIVELQTETDFIISSNSEEI